MEIDDVYSFRHCQCCFIENCNKNLYSEHSSMDQKEIFGEMLADVFNIKVPRGFICDICAVRLRDTVSFKKLVLKTQECFKHILKNTSEEDPKEIVEVKNENDTEDVFTAEDYEEATHISSNIIDDFDMPLSEVKKNITKNEKDCHRKILSKRKKITAETALVKPNVKEGYSKGEKREKEETVREGTYSRVNTIKLIKYSNICPFRCLRNSLECFCCKNTFLDIDLLRKHMATHKKKQVINKLRQFKNGLLKVDVSAILCEICSESINRIDDLKTHLHLAHKVIFETPSADLIPFKLDEHIYKCQMCSELFKHFHKLNIHMNLHYQNFICEKCGVGFSNLYNLKEHVLRHDAKSYECRDCNLEFATVYKRDQHNIVVHKRMLRRRCPYCPDRFNGHYTKLIHMIKVHNVERTEFKCNSCEKVFLRKFMLNSHMRKSHMNERSHECRVCGSIFFSKFDLRQHMASHTGEKKHVCTDCGKAFARKGTLGEHVKIHES